MKDPRHEIFERLSKRALELGNVGSGTDYRELLELIKSEYPIVRKTAASALDKLLSREESLAPICKVGLILAIERETGEQTLLFLLRAIAKCATEFNIMDFEILRDIARNPNHKDYVRAAANEAVALGEGVTKDKIARRRHWCTRCRKPISAEESQRGIDKYGKPYCFHCLNERIHEDANFEANVEAAKRLRTVDMVAVQSKGEKRIGDWLNANHIAYVYDERITVAGDFQMRPDFYLPEFDIYIEYWGMNTPEYIANMKKKQFLYQREGKRLISLSYKEFGDLEDILRLKLSRYIRI